MNHRIPGVIKDTPDLSFKTEAAFVCRTTRSLLIEQAKRQRYDVNGQRIWLSEGAAYIFVHIVQGCYSGTFLLGSKHVFTAKLLNITLYLSVSRL